MGRKFKWTVEFFVDESWVADGFDLTKDRALRMLENDLQFAYGSELGARIVGRPADKAIAKTQGFHTVKEWRAANKRTKRPQ